MSTWVFGAERWDNLIYYALGGHKDAIVACFFEASSLDVCPHRSLEWGAGPSPWTWGAMVVRQASAAQGHVLIPVAWVGVGWRLGNPPRLTRLPLQLYTLSQDGALCVWQCDTLPEDLRLKAPTGWKADLLQREEEEEEEEEGAERETTVRGKATPAAEEQQGKVKYSRLAK